MKNSLLAEFSVIASAEGGPNSIRDLILELAIRGKLTSGAAEKPLDISAAVLEDFEGFTPSFALPSGWEWVTGKKLFSFVTSGTRGWAEYYSNDGPIFLRIGNLDYRTTALDLSSVQRVRPPANAEGTRTKVQPGDVLISITGDTGMVGVAPDDVGEAYINQHIALARPDRAAFPQYVGWALVAPSLLGRLQRAQRGIKNSLGLGDIGSLSIPLPPLAEQKRIVAKVDQLMALCDDLEAKQTKKRDLTTQSTHSALTALTTAETPPELAVAWRRVEEGFGSFVASAADIPAVREAVLALAVRGQFQQSGKQNFEREVRSDNATFALPVGWSWRTVDSVTQLVTDGEHLTPPRIASGIPLVTAKNVRAGFMDLTTTDWVSREVAQKCWQRCAPKKGDILMVCVGATTGRVCVLGDTEPFVLVRSVALLRTDESKTTAAWLALFLRSPEGQRQIWANVKEQAQPCLYLNRMKGMSLPVPLLADQRRIVAKVDHLMSLLDDLEAKLRKQEQTATRLAESLAAAVAA